MSAAPSTSPASLPNVTLAEFEGPLDLLLHLIREHRINIADIPIVQVTDYYLGYLRAMEQMNLTIAGEFLVMAATLLEIKSRMLLPKPPKEEMEDGSEGEDPRQALVEQLQDYQRYKALVGTFAEWEDARRQLFFRAEAEFGELYELPVAFGEISASSLTRALMQVLDRAGASTENQVTSVRRQKLTLRLAMTSLWRKIEKAGDDGVPFDECFDLPITMLSAIMTFLALLELLRQARIVAEQEALLGTITVRMNTADDTPVELPAEHAPEPAL